MAEGDEAKKVLLCSECFAAIGGGSCGDHPDDPPLDPTKPEVKDLLADKDAEALTRLQRRFMAIGAIPGAVAFVGLIAIQAVSEVAFPVKAAAAFLAFVGLTIGRMVANRRFKPRFTRWAGHDYKMDYETEALLDESRGPWSREP